MTARLCVIVLTRNQWENTRACLESVERAGRTSRQVVVVDNASTDNTVVQVRQSFPDVKLIVNSMNLGYAAGNNLGLQFALENRFEYAMILNNDVIVEKDCLDTLLQVADENPDAALFGPMVYHAQEPEIIQSAGGMLPETWRSYHRGANQIDRSQFSEIEQVDWLTGCAVVARTKALALFGLLDTAFFMYGEDVDWGVRARRAGFQILFVPRARVWHSGVQRDYAPAPYVTYYSARNELHLIQKHHAGVSALLKAWIRHTRTIASWSLRPRWHNQRAQRNALVRALRDALLHRTGPAV